MTPLQHYRRAEELLRVAASMVAQDFRDAGCTHLDRDQVLVAAGVHATLATVPAVVGHREPGEYGRPTHVGER